MSIDLTPRLRVTPVQRQIIEHQRRFPTSSAYNMSYAFKIEGADPQRIAAAVRTAVSSHPILGQRFAPEGTDFVLGTDEPHRDIVQVTTDTRPEEEIEDRLRQRARQPFNPLVGPLADIAVTLHPRATYLLLAVHHSVFDISSLESLLRQIEREYDGEETTAPSRPFSCDIPELAGAAEVDAAAAEAAMQHINTLACPGIAPLPPNTQPGYWRDEACDAAPVQTLAEKYGVSRFEVLTTLFAITLSEMIGETCVTFGIPFANRRPEHRQSIGMFVNTLPLRVDLAQDTTFSGLLAQVTDGLRRLRAAEPLDVSSYLADHAADASGYSCVMTYYNKWEGLTLPDARVTRLERVYVDQSFPISVIFERADDQLLVRTCTDARFASADVARAVDWLAHQLSDSPDGDLASLTLMPTTAETELIDQVNAAASTYAPQAERPVDRFAHMAATFPDHAALRYERTLLTYARLDQLTDAMAHVIRERCAGDHIVISEPPSAMLVAGVLAVMKAGKIYVPLDDNMPASRRDMIIAALPSCSVMGAGGDLGSAEEIAAQAEGRREAGRPEVGSPDDVAYVLFTSGSTGLPKGVEVTHANLQSLFDASTHEMEFGPEDVWTMFHSYSFDFSLWEMLGCLTSGGTLVVVPRDMRRAPDAFHRLLVDERVTVLCQTPAAFANLLRVELSARPKLHQLRYILLGGEFLCYETVRTWLERYGDEAPQCFGLYGFTEAAVISLGHPLASSYDDEIDILGKPWANTRCYVETVGGRIAPEGFRGEIVVSGPGVSSGYLGNAVTTSGFADESLICSERTFRSRDGGYLDHNRDVVFESRMDGQVKLGGHRVETGEVEHACTRHPDCVDACAVLHDFGHGDKRLVAYFVPAQGTDLEPEALREFLSTQLQSYMLPTVLTPIAAKPLTTNGKLDYSALPSPVVELAPVDKPDGDSDTPADRVRGIWGRVLNRGGLRLSDSFFDVGGTSLLMSDVYFQLLEEFHLGLDDLSIIDLFDYPTPALLGGFLAELQAVEGGERL